MSIEFDYPISVDWACERLFNNHEKFTKLIKFLDSQGFLIITAQSETISQKGVLTMKHPETFQSVKLVFTFNNNGFSYRLEDNTNFQLEL